MTDLYTRLTVSVTLAGAWLTLATGVFPNTVFDRGLRGAGVGVGTEDGGDQARRRGEVPSVENYGDIRGAQRLQVI